MAAKQTPAQKRAADRKLVVRNRDQKKMSWATIGEGIGVSPKTARRMYDEVKGEGAHHGLLEGKGGRTPTTKPVAKATKAPAKKAPAKAQAKKAA